MIPQDVPGMVARLQDDLLMPNYARYVQHLAESMDESKAQPGPPAAPDAGRVFCRGLHDELNICRLFHVSEPMTAVSRQAAEQLPDVGIRWEEDTMPSRNGFLVFQSPLILVDVWNRPVSVSAMQWSWRPYGVPGEVGRAGWLMTLFSDRRDIRDYYIAKDAAEHGGELPSLGTSGDLLLFETTFLRLGHPLGEWVTDNIEAVEIFRRENIIKMPEGEVPEWDHNGPPSTINLGRISYAIFALMQQELADVSDWEDRRLARRNRGKKRPPHTVTIIELRRRHHYGAYNLGTGTFLTYRSVTSGYWKSQPYGPRNDPHYKRIFVNAYWRGPEGAPIRQTKRVTTLKR